MIPPIRVPALCQHCEKDRIIGGSSVFLWNVGEVELVPFHAQCLGPWLLTVMPRDVRRTEGDPNQVDLLEYEQNETKRLEEGLIG